MKKYQISLNYVKGVLSAFHLKSHFIDFKKIIYWWCLQPLKLDSLSYLVSFPTKERSSNVPNDDDDDVVEIKIENRLLRREKSWIWRWHVNTLKLILFHYFKSHTLLSQSIHHELSATESWSEWNEKKKNI